MISINSERLKRSLEEMGEIGLNDPGAGRTRLTLSQEDREGRNLFVRWLEEAGMRICIDPVGNIWGIRKGRDMKAKPVMAGSHLDTVKNAGMFDGALGVLAALEVIRTLNDRNICTEKPLAVAAFTNEEGARFQPDMMGSMFAAGLLDLEKALGSMDDDHVTVGMALQDMGYSGNDRLEASAYLELHVEQGPVLHREGMDIGIVQGIQGIAWWYGTYTGEANHAGTTPLEYRKDSLLAAAELCCELRKLAEELGNDSRSTVGRLHPLPDVVNVIPAETWFTIDFRQYDKNLFERGKERVESLVAEIAEKHGLDFHLEKRVDAIPIRFPLSMVHLVERVARKNGYSYMNLPSGAGHDAQFMHRLCPTAMIFVPSIGGRSHCPEERTDWKDVDRGADVLLKSMLELAGQVSDSERT